MKLASFVLKLYIDDDISYSVNENKNIENKKDSE